MTHRQILYWGKYDRMSHFRFIVRNQNIIGTHFVNSVVYVDKTIWFSSQSIWNVPNKNCSPNIVEILSMNGQAMRHEKYYI